MTEPRRVQRATYGSDGVFYGVGSTPPEDIAAEFGDHIWQAPDVEASGGLLMPMVQAPTEPFTVQVTPTEPTPAPQAAPAEDAVQPEARPKARQRRGGIDVPPH